MNETPSPRSRRRSRGPWPLVLLVVAIALGSGGCGGDDETAPIMNVDLTLTPNPAAASVSDLEGFDWVVVLDARLEESGGLGGTLSGLAVTLYHVVDGVETLLETGQSNVEIPSNRLDANGTAEFVVTTHYSAESPAILHDVFVQIVDDDGFSLQVGDRAVVE